MECYSRLITVDLGFHRAVFRVTKALEEAGFFVMAATDLERLLRRRLGRKVKPYVILEVCDLALTASVLDVDPDLAMVVPYTLGIHELGAGRTVVTVAEHLEEFISRRAWREAHPEHREIVAAVFEAEERLGRVLASIKRPERTEAVVAKARAAPVGRGASRLGSLAGTPTRPTGAG